MRLDDSNGMLCQTLLSKSCIKISIDGSFAVGMICSLMVKDLNWLHCSFA